MCEIYEKLTKLLERSACIIEKVNEHTYMYRNYANENIAQFTRKRGVHGAPSHEVFPFTYLKEQEAKKLFELIEKHTKMATDTGRLCA